MGEGTASAPLPDLAGDWSSFQLSFDLPPTGASALCSVAVSPDDPGEPDLDACLDRLTLTASLLFGDGRPHAG